MLKLAIRFNGESISIKKRRIRNPVKVLRFCKE